MARTITYETLKADFEKGLVSKNEIFDALKYERTQAGKILMPTLGTLDAEFVNREAQAISQHEADSLVHETNIQALNRIIAEFGLTDTRNDYSKTVHGIQEWDD